MFLFPGLAFLGSLPMTVVARNIGVHFLDEKTIANLSRIMFTHRATLNTNSTKDTPVSSTLFEDLSFDIKKEKC